MHIVVATGVWWMPQRYFSAHGVDAVAELFIRDITRASAPSGVKAAIIKCATDTAGVTPVIDNILRASARAQKATGVPISTDTLAAGRTGEMQQAIFAQEGVDLSRVIIGHSGDSEDLTATTMRAPNARQTDTGTGLTRAPSISQRPLILHRAEDAGQREGRLKRVHQAAFIEPDLMAGAELGGDRHEFPLQPLDGDILQMVLETAAQALAGDQARASEIDVEKAEDPARGQRRGEILKRLKAAGHVASAGDGTDRRSGDDVRLKSSVDQRLEYPDMGPSARRAAAKGDANNRSRHFNLTHAHA